MRVIYVTADRDATQFYIRGVYRRLTGRVVATNKSGVIDIFSNVIMFEEQVQVTIPNAYTNASNLPATLEIEVFDSVGGWREIAEVRLEIPISNDGDGVTDNVAVTNAVPVTQGGPLSVTVLNPGTGGGTGTFPAEYPLPASQVQIDAITNTQLRSAPIDVGGQVSLDAATLAALESVTIAVANGQIIGLDSVTLAALENIVVSGTVALDTATLAALENINATITGTVALDTATLAALETINATVTGTVNVGNFPVTQTDALNNTQLRATPIAVLQRASNLVQDSARQTLRVSTAYSESATGPIANSILVNVPTGSRIRLLRNAGHVDPTTALEAFPIVTLKIGSTVIYKDKLEAGLPWSETVCFEGADGEDLTLSIDSNVVLYLNMRYEVF
jgi:hypothetical protein